MITQNTIQQILDRLDIIDVVGDFVKLKKRGTNYIGNCPFHNEKTPSFTVSPSKEIYKCFGCGKSGNTISFVMEHEKYSYIDALKWLAKKYNIEVEETYVSDEQRLQYQTADSLYIINQFAQQFFAHSLWETEEGQDIALSYFKERGFREEIIKKFQLGYSPEKADAFAKEAIAKQYNADLLLKTGLVVNRNQQLLDNYRGRVIFPIHNSSGKITGFGARILKTNDRAPKYINTPENEIYIKSKILYGSYFARTAIDKADECLLVEGYTDVVSLHQAGIENVVASGGTSLTIDQLRLIRKYTNNLTIIYDGDGAGVKAAMRGLDMALEEGLNVKLVLIPDKEDPDSYVNKIGAAAFQDFVKAEKKDVILFQLEVALKDAGNDAAQKSSLVNRMAETISKINKAEDFTKQQDYIRQVSEILKIDEAGLTALVNQFIRDKLAAMEKRQAGITEEERAANARQGEETEFHDATYNLLFKDDLQEREIARILLEHGLKSFDDNRLVAEYVFDEMVEDSLMDNMEVLNMIKLFKEAYSRDTSLPDKNFFIYNEHAGVSTLAVSLLNFPYEESEHWRKTAAQSTGYQQSLFKQSYEDFMRVMSQGNEESLQRFSKIDEDRTNEAVVSAIKYLRLRKLKRMLSDNQADMEKPHTEEELLVLTSTHAYLKNEEISLTREVGTVIYR
jgi:DNA primase